MPKLQRLHTEADTEADTAPTAICFGQLERYLLRYGGSVWSHWYPLRFGATEGRSRGKACVRACVLTGDRTYKKSDRSVVGQDGKRVLGVECMVEGRERPAG